MALRVIVLLVFAVFGLCLFSAALFGRLYAKSSEEAYYDAHVMYVVGAVISMVIAIAGVEILKYIEGSLGHGIVRTIHLTAVVPFLLLFLSAFLFSGIRAPRYHRVLVYPCLVLFIAVFIAGAAMLLGIAT